MMATWWFWLTLIFAAWAVTGATMALFWVVQSTLGVPRGSRRGSPHPTGRRPEGV